MDMKQDLIDAYNRKGDAAFDRAIDLVDCAIHDIAQAHHVLDVLGVRRSILDSDGKGRSLLTLLGRMRIVQDNITNAPGATAQKCIISDECRRSRGDEGVIDETLARVRNSLASILGGWGIGNGVKVYVTVNVERPK